MLFSPPNAGSVSQFHQNTPLNHFLFPSSMFPGFQSEVNKAKYCFFCLMSGVTSGSGNDGISERYPTSVKMMGRLNLVAKSLSPVTVLLWLLILGLTLELAVSVLLAVILLVVLRLGLRLRDEVCEGE